MLRSQKGSHTTCNKYNWYKEKGDQLVLSVVLFLARSGPTTWCTEEQCVLCCCLTQLVKLWSWSIESQWLRGNTTGQMSRIGSWATHSEDCCLRRVFKCFAYFFKCLCTSLPRHLYSDDIFILITSKNIPRSLRFSCLNWVRRILTEWELFQRGNSFHTYDI